MSPGSPGARSAATILVVAWVAFSAANLYSVARFSYWTVTAATLTLPVLLGVLALTRRAGLGAPPRAVVSAALLAVAVAVERLRFFTYLPAEQSEIAVHLVAATCVVAAVLWLLPHRRAGDAALAVAVLCFLATSWLVISYDPAPRIDVWISLTQGTDGLLEGRNPYSATWVDSPGVHDAFTYLPMTAVLLAPFNWVLGDVRWGLTAAMLLTVWLLPRLDRRTSDRRTSDRRTSDRTALAAGHREKQSPARAAGLLLLLTPGQLVQSEQSWTEPLLLCLLVAMLWCLQRGRTTAAVLALAVALATKQHMALLLPVLACWRPLGVRRSVLAAAGAGLLCLPWFLWSPRDFFRDTVTFLLDFPPLRLSPDLYIAAYRNGWTPPFWLTGVIVLVALVASATAVRRTQPPLWRLALLLAVALLAVNLVNKQTFYNQYWFVGSLMLVALASARPRGSTGEQALEPDGDVVPLPGVEDPAAPPLTHGPGEVRVGKEVRDARGDR